MTNSKITLGEVITALPNIYATCYRGTAIFELLEKLNRHITRESGFARNEGEDLGPFGEINLPLVSMGAISSLDLFGLDELVLFSIYNQLRKRYKRFADLGANIGLHTILGARLGWETSAYEPDPDTFAQMSSNAALNGATISASQCAVGARDETRSFTRVNGNRTGSHLSGSKPDPYGELEHFSVEVKSFVEILNGHDFLKIDVEGAEAELFCSSSAADWARSEAVMEIGSANSAREISSHLTKSPGINTFAQKIGWRKVTSASDLPTFHREGSVFISSELRPPFLLPIPFKG